jgi:hypothetical protein
MTALSVFGMALMGSAVDRPAPTSSAERAAWPFLQRAATWAAPSAVFAGYLLSLANAWARVQDAVDTGAVARIPDFVSAIVVLEFVALSLFPLISLLSVFMSDRTREAAWITASLVSKVPLALIILFAQRKAA